MDSIRIKNLRSLKDTEYINFKELTILVGENSAGKSTLIRTFPLIKQSIETETTTPFLWYGNNVDFGSFKECLNRDNENEIEFRFKFKLDLRKFIYKKMYLNLESKNIINFEISISIKEKEENDYVSRLNLLIEDNEVDIIINKKSKIDKLTINSEDLTNMVKDIIIVSSNRGIIPSFYRNLKNDEKFDPLGMRSYNRFLFRQNKFDEELISLIKSNVHVRSTTNTIFKILDSFNISSKENFKKSIRETKTDLKSWNKFISNSSNIEIEHIQNLYLGSILQEILFEASEFISGFYKNAYYIAPVRANAERYYRLQNLSVDSVDFQGRNLPMLLANLSQKKKDEFSNWVQSNFGFGIKLQVSDGHISVNIIKENETINMADCGFGYSQILPIITQLWLLTNKKNKRFSNNNLTLIIEQPELHLHPKLQANLIDTFIDCINTCKSMDINLKIIIETHSETIINRIGYQIYKNNLPKDNVNIYIFNKLNINQTKVISGTYDEEGFLNNWPSGFFDPKED